MGLEETDRYQSPVESCGRITASLRKDCDLIAPKPQPCLRTSEVGRFLRKRQCKGSRTAAETDHSKDGPLGDRSLPRKSSGYIQGSYHKLSLAQVPPRWGDFSESANVRGAGPPQRQTTAETDHRKDGPLGDRSLPQKLIRLNPGILPKTQPQSSGRPDGS
jgi:hypothetical protein